MIIQISDLLGRETALCNTLWLLKDAAQKTFFDILKGRGEKLLRYPPLVSVDLSPPAAVREGVSLLLEIIDNYNGMMVPASGKKPPFDPVISAILDPIIQVYISICHSDTCICYCDLLAGMKQSDLVVPNLSFLCNAVCL